MFALHTLILVIHISSAAITVGASTGLLRHLRRALEAGQVTFALAAEDAFRRGKIMAMSTLATLWTGLVLIFDLGGFKAVPLNIHIALALMLLVIGTLFAVSRPASALLVEQSKAPEIDKVRVGKSLKKLAMAQGIVHLLWLSILVLMLVRIEK